MCSFFTAYTEVTPPIIQWNNCTVLLWQHAMIHSNSTIKKKVIIKIKLNAVLEYHHILINTSKAITIQCIMQNIEHHHPSLNKPQLHAYHLFSYWKSNENNISQRTVSCLDAVFFINANCPRTYYYLISTIQTTAWTKWSLKSLTLWTFSTTYTHMCT
jgi:hypothetical protein